MMTIDRLNKPTMITDLDTALKIAEDNNKTDQGGWRYIAICEDFGVYYVDVYEYTEPGQPIGKFIGRL